MKKVKPHTERLIPQQKRKKRGVFCSGCKDFKNDLSKWKGCMGVIVFSKTLSVKEEEKII